MAAFFGLLEKSTVAPGTLAPEAPRLETRTFDLRACFPAVYLMLPARPDHHKGHEGFVLVSGQSQDREVPCQGSVAVSMFNGSQGLCWTVAEFSVVFR